MKLFIIFLIVFLALAGIGSIWYISSRDKCMLPDKSNCGNDAASDGYPKLPMCTDPDGMPTCELQTKVCGSKPECAGSLSCDYKTKKWICSGSGGGGGTPKYCTLNAKGELNFPIFIDGTNTKSTSPVENSLKYTVTSFPGFTGGYGCVLSECEKDYHVSNTENDKGGANGQCVPDDKPDQTGCPEAVFPIKSWTKDTGGNCIVKECYNTSNKKTGVVVKYILKDGNCQPDCNDNSTVNYFLTGNSNTLDPKTNLPIKYFQAQLSKDGKTCVPIDNDSSLWGGCGSTSNPSFAIDPDNKTMCKQTVNTQFATFTDEGCVLCQPKYCPLGATDLTQCVGDTACGYAGVSIGKNTSENAVDFCVSQQTGQVFGPYTGNLIYKNQKTFGRPIKKLKFLFSSDLAAKNIAIYTVDHDDKLTLVRQAPTQGATYEGDTPWYSFNTDSPYYVITTENDFLYDDNWTKQKSKWWYVSTDELYKYMADNNKKSATIVLDFPDNIFNSVALYKGVKFDDDTNLSLTGTDEEYKVLTCCNTDSYVCGQKNYKKSTNCQWW